MTKWIWIIFVGLLVSQTALAAFSNYNSVLIGERAAGMGGAFTALSGDPAAASYYNPATLARMKGSTLSAAVSVYHKYDTDFGQQDNFSEAPLKMNRGSIVPIPASSGTLYSFRNFAFGLSILFPDFDIYTGQVRNQNTASSYLNLRDESLWVGGSLAMNLTDRDSLGISMYYSSRTYNHSITDRKEEAGVTTIASEEKSFSHNSLIYILGFYRQLTEQLTLGLSYRPASLPISGVGTFFSSQISTSGTVLSPTRDSDIHSQTVVPARWAIGLAIEEKNQWTLSLDLNHYEAAEYVDLKHEEAGQHIQHRPTWNVSLGGEHYLKPWLALRLGLYSNLSSHDKIPQSPSQRTGDHIDMWGFSTNLAIHTSPQTRVTLGGYYTGGKGYSTQQVGQEILRIPKSQQIFSFLVGTSFYF